VADRVDHAFSTRAQRVDVVDQHNTVVHAGADKQDDPIKLNMLKVMPKV
jgi:hypothetical protein